MLKNFSKYLILFLLTALLLCDSGFVLAEVPKAPQTFKEAETMGKEILWGFPQALRKPWQEAVAVWGKMGGWFGNFWNSYISLWLSDVWQKRKPEVKEEFEKEKQEMREDVFKGTKTLWQRFKELIR